MFLAGLGVGGFDPMFKDMGFFHLRILSDRIADAASTAAIFFLCGFALWFVELLFFFLLFDRNGRIYTPFFCYSRRLLEFGSMLDFAGSGV